MRAFSPTRSPRRSAGSASTAASFAGNLDGGQVVGLQHGPARDVARHGDHGAMIGGGGVDGRGQPAEDDKGYAQR